MITNNGLEKRQGPVPLKITSPPTQKLNSLLYLTLFQPPSNLAQIIDLHQHNSLATTFWVFLMLRVRYGIIEANGCALQHNVDTARKAR